MKYEQPCALVSFSSQSSVFGKTSLLADTNFSTTPPRPAYTSPASSRSCYPLACSGLAGPPFHPFTGFRPLWLSAVLVWVFSRSTSQLSTTWPIRTIGSLVQRLLLSLAVRSRVSRAQNLSFFCSALTLTDILIRP